jgi:hypothetical protein
MNITNKIPKKIRKNIKGDALLGVGVSLMLVLFVALFFQPPIKYKIPALTKLGDMTKSVTGFSIESGKLNMLLLTKIFASVFLLQSFGKISFGKYILVILIQEILIGMLVNKASFILHVTILILCHKDFWITLKKLLTGEDVSISF